MSVNFFTKMAVPAGFEPTIFRLTAGLIKPDYDTEPITRLITNQSRGSKSPAKSQSSTTNPRIFKSAK